jgi:hypothetical protein
LATFYVSRKKKRKENKTKQKNTSLYNKGLTYGIRSKNSFFVIKLRMKSMEWLTINAPKFHEDNTHNNSCSSQIGKESQ